ncbi:MAG: hypothetical protein L0Z53_14570 [Acidobacteriales bacterium]|nr:hypothetical protein [Terriglobales bacterium]
MAAVLLSCACGLAPAATAAELKQKTATAFDHYVQLTEARMAEELRPGNPFFSIDRMPETERVQMYAKLRDGHVHLERVQTREAGEKIEMPDGLVHHWVGMVFIPGATLQSVLAVVQDYDNHQVTYKPYVQRSRLVRREGNEFDFFLRFHRKAIVTVVLNADFTAKFTPVSPTRMQGRSYSTRIADVENPGEPDERERPAAKDRGFLWRLNTYSRLEERDGGVYFQLESIALTRRVPFALRWLISPFVERIPRESLSMLLTATRKAVIGPKPAPLSRKSYSEGQPGD